MNYYCWSILISIHTYTHYFKGKCLSWFWLWEGGERNKEECRCMSRDGHKPSQNQKFVLNWTGLWKASSCPSWTNCPQTKWTTHFMCRSGLRTHLNLNASWVHFCNVLLPQCDGSELWRRLKASWAHFHHTITTAPHPSQTGLWNFKSMVSEILQTTNPHKLPFFLFLLISTWEQMLTVHTTTVMDG